MTHIKVHLGPFQLIVGHLYILYLGLQYTIYKTQLPFLVISGKLSTVLWNGITSNGLNLEFSLSCNNKKVFFEKKVGRSYWLSCLLFPYLCIHTSGQDNKYTLYYLIDANFGYFQQRLCVLALLKISNFGSFTWFEVVPIFLHIHAYTT